MSTNLIAIIRVRLEKAKAEYAEAALTTPALGGDMTFAYGKAVGFNTALASALAIIESVITEDANRERADPPLFPH